MAQSSYLCNVISLIGHIEYLILHHECVVIPGIGALIARRTPAYIDKQSGRIFPPARNLSFNPEIVHNDGLLVSSVARKECVTYEEAMNRVNVQVQEIQALIRTQKELALGRLGILRINEENSSTYMFDPFESTNISPISTGFTPIGIRTLTELSAVESSDIKENSSRKEIFYLPISRSISRIAASIAVFLMLGFALSTPIIDNDANRASIGITIVETASADAYSPMFDDAPNIGLNIAIPSIEDAVATIDTTLSASDANTDAMAGGKLNPDDEYFLVVASLPSKELAEEYVRDHSKSRNLGVLEADGRFRVYAASGSTYAEANSFNKSGRYPDAWVCKR